MSDLYYESTIVVHDKYHKMYIVDVNDRNFKLY